MARNRNKPSEPKRSAIGHARIMQGLPGLIRQRNQAILIDRWTTGTQQQIEDFNDDGVHQGMPYIPRKQEQYAKGESGGEEFLDTASKSAAPFGRLVVSSVAQTIFLEGAKIHGADKNMNAYNTLIRNNWLRQQQAHTRATVGHGLSFISVIPGKDPLSGKDLPRVRAHSAKRVAVFFEEEGNEWAEYAIKLGPGQVDEEGKAFRAIEYWDDSVVLQYTLHDIDINANRGTTVLFEEKDLRFDRQVMSHAIGVCPIVPYYNMVDLEGNPSGEIAPIIPLLRRLDQDTFDRLIVQRFGAWKIRYIAGMAKPENAAEERAQKLNLTAADLLVSSDPDTKFGAIDGTPINGYIEATDHDLRILAAVTQTPPHHLLGLSSNLQAEALAASEAGLQRKSLDFRMTNGGAHEQMLRLIALAQKDRAEATSDEIEITWRDTESRSLEQAARALATLATQLEIPAELLWDRVPGWTESDSERAKELIEDGLADQMIEAMAAMGAEPEAKPGAPDPTKGGGGGDNEPK